MEKAILETSLDYPCKRGKVRDVYDLGDELLIVSSDRISAFDWILPSGIPSKGIVLTQISRFWFEQLGVPHHLLSTELGQLTEEMTATQAEQLRGRSMLVKKCEVVPFECVVRGYLEGSGWREYQQSGTVCGIALPSGLRQCDRLPEPIYTPATKAVEGHDENVTFEYVANALGTGLAENLKTQSLAIFERGSRMAQEKGIIIADTKFEFGLHQGELILVDEVLTPDSSRFWPADAYAPGGPQPSFDKQFVREWLMATDWDRNSPPPALPDDIVARTREKYIDVFERLTGQAFGS